MLLPHVRSVYISIMGKRVSIPAGKYSVGWEDCRRAQPETEGRIKKSMIVHLWIYLYARVKPLQYPLHYILCIHVFIPDCVLPNVLDSVT